eukprot:1161824-Pelagomonas_calceolata.AAC.1
MQALTTPQMQVCQGARPSPVPHCLSGAALPLRSARHLTRRAPAGAAAARNGRTCCIVIQCAPDFDVPSTRLSQSTPLPQG